MYGNSIGTRKTWIGVYLINDKFLDIGFKEKFKFKHHTSKFLDKLQQGVGLKQTNNSGISTSYNIKINNHRFHINKIQNCRYVMLYWTVLDGTVVINRNALDAIFLANTNFILSVACRKRLLLILIFFLRTKSGSIYEQKSIILQKNVIIIKDMIKLYNFPQTKLQDLLSMTRMKVAQLL